MNLMPIVKYKLYFIPYSKNSLLSPKKFPSNYFTVKKISNNYSQNQLLSKYKLYANKLSNSGLPNLTHINRMSRSKSKSPINFKFIKSYEKPSMIKIIEKNKEEENKIFLKPFYDKIIQKAKHNDMPNKFVKLMIKKIINKNNTMKNLFEYNINFKGDCFRANSIDNIKHIPKKKSISPINFMEIIKLNIHQSVN